VVAYAARMQDIGPSPVLLVALVVVIAIAVLVAVGRRR